MKRVHQSLTSNQKEILAYYTQEFITQHFSNKIHQPLDMLKRSVAYFNNNTLGESILKQTLLKAAFPRSSWRKDMILSEMKDTISPKIGIALATEKTDFRFISELQAASALADSTDIIKRVIMKSEKPNKNLEITTGGNRNTNKDITLEYGVDNSNILQGDWDAKSGNNAYNPFSGTISKIAYAPNMTCHAVINDALFLEDIQAKRLKVFEGLALQNSEISPYIRHIKEINISSLDIIEKNILIQEEIFKMLGYKLIPNTPSFYTGYIVHDKNILHPLFINKILPSINSNIFDNKQNAKVFLTKALIAYNQSVDDIAENIKQTQSLFKESGFAEIAHDIFN